MSDQASYFDFEISIDRDGDGYVARVNSLGGRAEASLGPPFTADQRTIVRQALTNFALRASAQVRGPGADEVRQMKEYGERLFNQVFTGEVKDYFYRCWGQALQQDKGLRLRLAVDPSLDDLPWEFLCTGREFIALNPQTPVVRFIEQPLPIPPLKTELPLEILVVIASPGDQARLDSAAEKARISQALHSLQEHNFVRLTYLEGPDTWPRLIDALRPDHVHVLHFIGHGAFDEQRGEGVLLMEDQFGDTRNVGSEQLKLLMIGKRHLRLVMLNSCLGAAARAGEPFSSVGAGLVRAGLPAVIAMQFEVSDRAARLLAETFYESIALNLPVDQALTEARREIALIERDSLEWATPVIFMQVPDGQLFDLTRPATVTLDTDALVTERYSRKADEAFDQNDYDRAANYYTFLLAQNPANEKARNRIDLIQRLKKVKTTDSAWRDKLTRRADKAFDAQHLDQAQMLYKLLLDNDPKNEHAIQRLAMIEKLRSGPAVVPPPASPADPPRPPAAGASGPVCANCGWPVTQPLARFCPRCGRPLASAPAAVDPRTRVAEHLQAADEAYNRGRFADAAAAYRGVLALAPQDAEAARKLALSEQQVKLAALLSQARQQYEAAQYTQALTSLGNLRRLDPEWPGLAGLLELCECGQQYRQAISQLRAGHRDRGRELLQRVTAKQPEFRDAARRLAELETGGDGLLAEDPDGPWAA